MTPPRKPSTAKGGTAGRATAGTGGSRRRPAPPRGDQPLLRVSDLVAGFGVHQVLHGVSLDVGRGSIAALLGLNGAGKSVTLKTISGLVAAWSGSVRLDGDELTGQAPERRVGRGLAHVPQGRAVFPHLTVEQNLRLGAYTVRDGGAVKAGFAGVFDVFPVLAERLGQAAGTLSGGEQEMLAVGRALMSRPRLVLVDEPSQGLAPIVVDRLFDVLKTANAAGTTFLVVEQNVAFALELADRVFLMQKGEIVYRGEGRGLDTGTIMSLLGVGELVQLGAPKRASRKKEGSTTSGSSGRPRGGSRRRSSR